MKYGKYFIKKMYSYKELLHPLQWLLQLLEELYSDLYLPEYIQIKNQDFLKVFKPKQNKTNKNCHKILSKIGGV